VSSARERWWSSIGIPSSTAPSSCRPDSTTSPPFRSILRGGSSSWTPSAWVVSKVGTVRSTASHVACDGTDLIWYWVPCIRMTSSRPCPVVQSGSGATIASIWLYLPNGEWTSLVITAIQCRAVIAVSLTITSSNPWSTPTFNVSNSTTIGQLGIHTIHIHPRHIQTDWLTHRHFWRTHTDCSIQTIHTQKTFYENAKQQSIIRPYRLSTNWYDNYNYI